MARRLKIIALVFLLSTQAQAGFIRSFCGGAYRFLSELFSGPSYRTDHLDLAAIPENRRHLLFPRYDDRLAGFLRDLPPGSRVTLARFAREGADTLDGPVRFRRQRPRGPIDPRAPEVYDTQIVEPLTARDRTLLEVANIDRPGEVREAGVIVFRTDRREEFESPYFRGFEFGIPESMFIKIKIDAMSAFSRAQREGRIQGRLTEIEFSHVHPALDVLITPSDPARSATRHNHELDQPDVQIAREQSQGYRDVTFTIRAVTPNGYAYRMSFLDGRFVEPSTDIPQGVVVWPSRSE